MGSVGFLEAYGDVCHVGRCGVSGAMWGSRGLEASRCLGTLEPCGDLSLVGIYGTIGL